MIQHRLTQRLSSAEGSISPFILLLLPALIGFAGLAYDGGNLFAARREAANVAAAAARAGTNDIDIASLHAGNPELAPTAPATAIAFAFAQGVDTATSRRVESNVLEVVVSQSVDMTFMQIIGIRTQTVTGEARARASGGVTG